MDGLIFQPDGHRYILDGREVPSVTRVLADVGLIPFANAELSAAAMRGSAVHEACRLDDLGTLDEASVSPTVAGYLGAWRAFRKAAGNVSFDLIEQPHASRIHLYAGTPDRCGYVKEQEDVRPLVLDIKTGAPARWHALQVAGYAEMLGIFHVAVRLSVHLKPNGRFRLVRHEDENDIHVFLAALTLRRWQKGAA